MKTKTLSTIATLVSAAFWFGCATQETTKQSETFQVATAYLNPTQGNNVRGTVTFTQVKDGVRVVADVTGLKPGQHGFHIHEKGDCSAPDASSAGGHFNPTQMPHGGPNMEKRHVGDLGNLMADGSGRARTNMVDRHLNCAGQIPFSNARSSFMKAAMI